LPATEVYIGICVAAVLSSLIGFEREKNGQPAGIRTHLILCVGAALAASLSISFSKFLSSPDLPSDPARIVAQVVSGVGFLGGGAILRYGVNIKGLTTASSLWTTAIIGIACGSGFYYEALFATGVVIIALVLVDKVVRKFVKTFKTHEISVKIPDKPGAIKTIRKKINKLGCRVLTITTIVGKNDMLDVGIVFSKPTELRLDRVIAALNNAK
jgi:putative Mg2+ transporter-C (MgtC) family protein